MLAQFSIWPLDRPHMSEDMAGLAQVLAASGVRYEVGPMCTTLQGDWHDVMKAIQACHEKMRNDHQRVLTSITIDDDATRTMEGPEATSRAASQRA